MKERFSIDMRANKLPLERQAENLARAGFTRAHFNIGFDMLDDLPALAKVARAHGVNPVNLHPPFMRNCNFWLDNEDRPAIIAEYERAIDCAGRAGLDSVIIHPTSGPSNAYVSQLGLEAFVHLVGFAKERGVNVCLENLRSPLHLDYLFGAIDAPNLKFCIDTGHNFLYNRDIDFLRRFGARLGFTHIADNDGKDDLHLPPGDGIIDWADRRAAFLEVGYQGTLNLEVMHPEYCEDEATHAAYARHCFEALIRVFGE